MSDKIFLPLIKNSGSRVFCAGFDNSYMIVWGSEKARIPNSYSYLTCWKLFLLSRVVTSVTSQWNLLYLYMDGTLIKPEQLQDIEREKPLHLN